MEFVLYIVAGLLGGVLGGMGMGGGTVLIPLLNIFYGVGQHLVSFIPMAIVALIFHLKNKLVEFDKILLIAVPGIFACILGCYIARAITGDLLRRCFGGFLILLSAFQLVLQFKNAE